MDTRSSFNVIIRSSFEDMVQRHFLNPDLERDPEYPEFYRDQAIQTTWAGFKAFHLSDSDTTKCAGINYEEDAAGNSRNLGEE